jgi:hypothetical protein
VNGHSRAAVLANGSIGRAWRGQSSRSVLRDCQVLDLPRLARSTEHLADRAAREATLTALGALGASGASHLGATHLGAALPRKALPVGHVVRFMMVEDQRCAHADVTSGFVRLSATVRCRERGTQNRSAREAHAQVE